MSMPIYLMFIRVLLSVEFCFTLKTYLKGALFYNASASRRSPLISSKPVSGPRHGCSQLGDCSKEALRGFRPYLDGSGVRKSAQNVRGNPVKIALLDFRAR